MIDERTIWRGAARQIRVTVTTSEDVSGWTLVWRAGPKEGDAAVLEKSLSFASGTLFTATLTAAESDALALGALIVFVIRTNAGSEDVLGLEQYTVRDTVLAA